MLGSSPVAPTIPVTDMARAKKFYGETLGLKEVSADIPGHTMFQAGKETMLVVYERGPSKADQTLAGFWVQDLESEMKELRGNGISFEEYDVPGLKTVNGVATIGSTKSAWFKDPDGNVLAMSQM